MAKKEDPIKKQASKKKPVKNKLPSIFVVEDGTVRLESSIIFIEDRDALGHRVVICIYIKNIGTKSLRLDAICSSHLYKITDFEPVNNGDNSFNVILTQLTVNNISNHSILTKEITTDNETSSLKFELKRDGVNPRMSVMYAKKPRHIIAYSSINK